MIMIGAIRVERLLPLRKPLPLPQGEAYWDLIDDQLDYLLDLRHTKECACAACDRRDRLIAILLEPKMWE